jgi:hypothetical protein
MNFYLVIHCNFFHVFRNFYNNFKNANNVCSILFLRKCFLSFFTHLQATVSSSLCYSHHRLESIVVWTNDGGCNIIVTTFRFLASVLALASLHFWKTLPAQRPLLSGFFFTPLRIAVLHTKQKYRPLICLFGLRRREISCSMNIRFTII